jgi:hypothetical protein
MRQLTINALLMRKKWLGFANEGEACAAVLL